MTDHLKPAARSALMSRVRATDTRPEIALRRALFAKGLRYRLHRRDLPGTPDIVFPSKRKVVFVHGCFWHRHPGCKYATTPKTNTKFWNDKFHRNVQRDGRNLADLTDLGWEAIVIWQCQIKELDKAVETVIHFLGNGAEEPEVAIKA